MLQNSSIGDKMKRHFGSFTEPTLPFKRDLTDDEQKKMYKHFQNHSWSSVDANGRIVLGGGEEAAGLYYILEEDLNKL